MLTLIALVNLGLLGRQPLRRRLDLQLSEPDRVAGHRRNRCPDGWAGGYQGNSGYAAVPGKDLRHRQYDGDRHGARPYPARFRERLAVRDVALGGVAAGIVGHFPSGSAANCITTVPPARRFAGKSAQRGLGMGIRGRPTRTAGVSGRGPARRGLCLYPDRYTYRYGDHQLGACDPVLGCAATGIAPPAGMPEVVRRAGLDLNPLDVTDPADLAWLDVLIWPEHAHRRTRRCPRRRRAAAARARRPGR
jgi:hypothetical protein